MEELQQEIRHRVLHFGISIRPGEKEAIESFSEYLLWTTSHTGDWLIVTSDCSAGISQVSLVQSARRKASSEEVGRYKAVRLETIRGKGNATN